MTKSNRNSVVSSVFWKFAERIGAQGVNLIVSIVLARILAPEDYGIVALVSIFITISNVFIENGLPTALIQKKEADNLDFSSVFYCNVIVSIILYIIVFLMSPAIAKFYNNEQLISVLRVLGISILIAGLKSVQNAYVSKKMIFKKFFICTSIGTIGSAFVGIWMAYKGYGVWALVTQQLFNTTVDTIMLWITVKWRPILKFSFQRLKGLFKYGWKMLCSAIMETVYNELYGLIIGKIYKPEQLAYYNKANQFPKLIMANVDGSISSVMLPALANEQDNIEKVKTMMKKAIKTSGFFLFPLIFGLMAVSESLIKVILTEKWMSIVPYMQLLCFSYVLWPMNSVNLQAISAKGRSDIYLKLEIIKKIIGITTLLVSCPFGMIAMVAMKAITSVVAAFINAFPNKKLLNYSFSEQLKDLLPSLILATIMNIVVFMIGKILVIEPIILLIIQVVIGAIIYIGIAYLLKFETITYCIEKLKKKINRTNT